MCYSIMEKEDLEKMENVIRKNRIKNIEKAIEELKKNEKKFSPEIYDGIRYSLELRLYHLEINK